MVAGSVLSLTGVGVAVADGRGSSSTVAVGEQLVQARDQLAGAVQVGDAPGVQRALDRMSPMLGDLATGEKYTVQADTRAVASSAKADADDANQVLTAKQAPAPSVLAALQDLLQALLEKVNALLSALLGTPPAAPPAA